MHGKVAVGVLGLALLATLLLLARPGSAPRAAPGPVQPILFSHAVHAGQYRIDCQYCHAGARRGAAAGIPSVERCFGCHKVTAADRPEIQKLAGFANEQRAIPWARIFKVPEYVSFPHKSHIRAEVKCQTCHGAVEKMAVVSAVTGQSLPNDLVNLAGLSPAAPLLTMGWCVECHRALNASEKRKAPLDCVACHH
jgi:hypothetical protein